MAGNVEDVGLRATLYGTATFLRNAQQVNQAMASVSSQAARTAQLSQRAGQQISGMSLNLGQLRHSLSGIQGPASMVSNAFGDIYYRLSRMGLMVWAAQQVAYTMSGLGHAVLRASADWEQYGTQMTVIMRSSDKAKDKMEELSAFARKTPFTLPQVMDAAVQLNAYGFAMEDLIPLMTTIGDAAMGNAEKFNRIIIALSQMRAAERVNSQDMRQLTEAGIPAWQILADSIGVTTGRVRELVEDGVVPAGPAIQALLAGMKAQFGGLGAAQAKTMNGILSNLSDWMFRARTILMDNVFEIIKKQLGDLLAYLDTPQFEVKLAEWGKGLGELTTSAIDFGERAIPVIKDAVQGIKEVADNLGKGWAAMPKEQQVGLLGAGAMYFVAPAFIGMLSSAVGLAAGINTALAGIPGILLEALSIGLILNATWRIMSGETKDFGVAMQRTVQGMAAWGAYGVKQIAAALDPKGPEAYENKVNDAKKTWEEANQAVEENKAAIVKAEAEVEKYQGMPSFGEMNHQAQLAAFQDQLQTLKQQQHQLEVNRDQAAQFWKDIWADYQKVANAPPLLERLMTKATTDFGQLILDQYYNAASQIESNPIHIQIALTNFSLMTGSSTALEEAYARQQVGPAPPSRTPTEEINAYVRALDAVDAAQRKADASKVDWGGIGAGTGSANSALRAMQRELQRTQKELNATEKAVQKLANARLPGMQAAEDEIFALEMALKKAQLAALGVSEAVQKEPEAVFDILAAQQREIAEGIPVALQKYEWDMEQARQKAEEAARKAREAGEKSQEKTPEEKEVERIQDLLEAAKLKYDLAYEPQLRKIRELYETLTGENEETPIDVILARLPQLIEQQTNLQTKVDMQQAAYDNMSDSLAGQKTASDGLLATRTNQVGVEKSIYEQYLLEEASIQRQLAMMNDINARGSGLGGKLTPEEQEKYGVPHLAEGGTIFNSGWAIVGERGPELAHLPARTTVYSNAASQRVVSSSMINNSRTQQNYGNNTFNAYGVQDAPNFMAELRQNALFARITAGR